MKLFYHWLIATLAILISAYLIPGVHTTVLAAVVLAVVLGIMNLFLRPLLFILTLPLTILTLGLFSLLINGFIVWVASMLVPDFSVAGFGTAFLFSIVLSLINILFSRGLKA